MTMGDDDLTTKLADLGQRIDSRIAEFRERGEFGDVHAAAFAGIEAKRARTEAEVARAVAAGRTGEVLRGEFLRNVDAIVDDFEAILFGIEADAMRKRKD
jgi:hypothetical protein